MIGKLLASGELTRQLIRGGIGSMALKGLGAALHLGISVLLARSLPVAEFGMYHYVMALVTLLAIPAQAGIPTLIVRLTATYNATGRWNLLAGLWLRTTQMVLAISCAVIVLTAIAHFVLPHAEFGDPAIRVVLLFALLAVPVNSLVETRSAALRGLGRVVTGQVPELIVRPFMQCALVAGVLIVPGLSLSAGWAMGFHLFASLTSLALAVWLLQNVRPNHLRGIDHAYETRPWVSSIIPLSALAGAQVLLQQTDAVMLGLMSGYETVASYRVATQGAAIVGFALLIATTVLSPHIARMYALRDHDRAQRVITVSARLVFLSAALLTLAFVAFGEIFLSVAFGAAYADSYWTLVMLCIGLLIKAGAGPSGAVLTMTGHEREAFYGVATATVANIVLNLLLIPRYGAAGAAAASALAFGIWSIQVTRLAYRKTGFDTTVIGAWRRTSSAPADGHPRPAADTGSGRP